jgi:hypothetical protein
MGKTSYSDPDPHKNQYPCLDRPKISTKKKTKLRLFKFRSAGSGSGLNLVDSQRWEKQGFEPTVLELSSVKDNEVLVVDF